MFRQFTPSLAGSYSGLAGDFDLSILGEFNLASLTAELPGLTYTNWHICVEHAVKLALCQDRVRIVLVLDHIGTRQGSNKLIHGQRRAFQGYCSRVRSRLYAESPQSGLLAQTADPTLFMPRVSVLGQSVAFCLMVFRREPFQHNPRVRLYFVVILGAYLLSILTRVANLLAHYRPSFDFRPKNE